MRRILASVLAALLFAALQPRMTVADEFCRLQGLQKARGFDWQYMKPTKTLRSGETCDADYCGGFTSITCE